MVAFLVTCIILVIVVGIQTIIAALGYILWRLFRDATDCHIVAGRCHCRATDGQRIPMDRKYRTIQYLTTVKDAQGRSRMRKARLYQRPLRENP